MKVRPATSSHKSSARRPRRWRTCQRCRTRQRSVGEAARGRSASAQAHNDTQQHAAAPARSAASSRERRADASTCAACAASSSQPGRAAATHLAQDVVIDGQPRAQAHGSGAARAPLWLAGTDPPRHALHSRCAPKPCRPLRWARQQACACRPAPSPRGAGAPRHLAPQPPPPPRLRRLARCASGRASTSTRAR